MGIEYYQRLSGMKCAEAEKLIKNEAGPLCINFEGVGQIKE